jgi:hypothetical protein
LVLTEGVIPYLSEEEVGAVASDPNKYPVSETPNLCWVEVDCAKITEWKEFRLF